MSDLRARITEAVSDVDHALAGSGEQPGEAHTDECLTVAARGGDARVCMCRPAPVVPDSAGLRDERDQDRADVLHWVETAISEGYVTPEGVDALLDRIKPLAVVGQGVTAAAVRDLIADEVDRDSSFFAEIERLLERAGSNPSTTADAVQDRLVERIRRAAVGQGVTAEPTTTEWGIQRDATTPMPSREAAEREIERQRSRKGGYRVTGQRLVQREVTPWRAAVRSGEQGGRE